MPDYSEVAKVTEDALLARLRAVRASIDHAGEKGRALEGAVQNILRQLLPAEFGLSTGFIAYTADDGPVLLSSQLDIIIYDALRGGPLIQLDGCAVFPIESVFAYCEVKAVLKSGGTVAAPGPSSIQGCLLQNLRVRQRNRRTYWVPIAGKGTQIQMKTVDGPPPRGYVVAFELEGSISTGSHLAQSLSDCSKELGAGVHLHGIFVPGAVFVETVPVEADAVGTDLQHRTRFVESHTLQAFAGSLLMSLARFPRPEAGWAAALERYLESPAWIERTPE